MKILIAILMLGTLSACSSTKWAEITDKMEQDRQERVAARADRTITNCHKGFGSNYTCVTQRAQ